MWDIDEGLIAAMPSVWGPVQLGLGRLEGPLHIDPLPCRRGDISPAYRGDRFELREGVVILDAQLFEGVGHDLSRHADVTLAVLEAHVRAALPSGGPAWLRAGLALDRAQAVLPEVSMVRADWERALKLDLGAEPRGGVAVVSAIRERGLGTLPDLLAWLEHGKVPTRAFVDAMVWLCRRGLKEHLARTPSLPAAEDIPLELTPWRAVPLCIPANRRGGKIRVEAGGGGVVPAWAPGGRVHHAVAVSTGSGCRFVPDLGGPIGRWEMRSAGAWGQVFGGRGLVYEFYGSGRFDVVLADAFVGTARDVSASESVGTSGTMRGRWRVDGPRRLEITELVPLGVTVHDREGATSPMPADSIGLAAAMQGLTESPWRWDIDEDGARLRMRGQIRNSAVDIRLARVR